MFEGLDENTEFGKAFQEKEFTFSPGLVPVNNGSAGAVPRRIQEVQIRLMREMNACPDLWFRETEYKYLTESVEAAAGFFSCDPKDLVFVTNATEAVNTILKSYDFKEGESVVSTSLTYGAVSLTCTQVAAKNKVIQAEVLDIQFPITSEDDVLGQYEEYFKSHPQTRIAAIGNFHKWLFTPRGCALLYVQRKHHDWVKPLVTSWWSDKSMGEQFARRGTCDLIPFMCVKHALEFFEKIGGMTPTSSYTSRLSTEAHDYLEELFQTEKLQIPKAMEAPNLKIVALPEINESNGKVQLPDFLLNFGKKTQIQTACNEIQGRYYVRLSTAIYNYMDEYKRLGDALIEYVNEINKQQMEQTDA